MTTWPRDTFARAVWRSSLKPLERLVALAYADHAGDQDTAGVAYPQLLAWTGLSSNGAVHKAVEGLREAGWLMLAEPASGRRAARYALCIPPGDGGLLGESSTASRWAPVDSAPSRGGQDPADPPPDGGRDLRSPPPHVDSPPPRGDENSENSEDRSIDARDAEAAAAIVAKYPHLADLAVDAVAGMWSWSRAETTKRPIHNIVGFAQTRSADEVKSYAASARQASAAAPTEDETCATCGGSGWLGHDGLDRPIVCGTCRPQLKKRLARQRAAAERVEYAAPMTATTVAAEAVG